MPKITQQEVLRIAALAKLAITDAEAIAFAPELDAIVGYFKKLQAVDTTGLEPTYQVSGVASVTRPDKLINYGTTQASLLANAPRKQGGSLEVPKVL